MKCKFFLTVAACLIAFATQAQSLYSSKNMEVSFFSKTPVEDIDAKNTQATSILNTKSQEVAFFIPIKGFRFKKDLMQEHFNEKYLESDLFPDASYKGKINESVDFTKNGTYDVTTTGKLKIHGIEKVVTEKGTITIKDGIINLKSAIKVALTDYNITIPKLVVSNIAETIDVSIAGDYTLYQKK